MVASNLTAGYSGDEVFIKWGPVLINSGYADGEFCTIEMDSDSAVDVVGTDGEVCVSRTNDRRATVTIKLLQSSQINTMMGIWYRTFIAGGGGIFPLLIKDLNGGARFSAPVSWILKPPDTSYDRTATTREWTIRCGHLSRVDAGNNPIFPGAPL